MPNADERQHRQKLLKVYQNSRRNAKMLMWAVGITLAVGAAAYMAIDMRYFLPFVIGANLAANFVFSMVRAQDDTEMIRHLERKLSEEHQPLRGRPET